MYENITSRSNKTIIEAAKLNNKKHREIQGLFCFEGKKLFAEACRSNVEFEKIFVTQKLYGEIKNLLDFTKAKVYTVSDEVYQKLSADKAPDGIFCVAKMLKSKNVAANATRFILCSVRDPGNLGTCIRTACAFNIGELILYDCADIYNPKVIRSSMGGFFRQNIKVTQDVNKTLSELIADGYRIYPTALADNCVPLSQITIDKKTVFAIGNEGHGISEEFIAACNKSPVIIPMTGDTESLNASVAASILMWELSKIR